jgi:hypothetical protein
VLRNRLLFIYRDVSRYITPTIKKHIKKNNHQFESNKNLLTKYFDTFRAFKELVNNSIQANSTQIEVLIDYTDEINFKSGIKKHFNFR